MNYLEKIKKNSVITESREELALKAFDYFFSLADKYIAQQGYFNVAISGGHTPTGFFEKIASQAKIKIIDWTKVQIYWVDERCVSPDSQASNYKMAVDTFLSKIPIPLAKGHRVAGGVADSYNAACEYESLIRQNFKLGPAEMPVFDLVVLGMGQDGHIGSLFPNSNALFDTQDIVVAVYSLDVSYNRITLTLPALQAACNIMVLISGVEKAAAVREIFSSEEENIKYPIHALWPVLEKIHWFMDRDAGKYIL